jgi:hypothetical protein
LILQVQLALIGSVSQSYVLISGALRLAAMTRQVSHDLRWLCQQCESVIIVAHSQGAAIVHHALRKGIPPEIKQLVTLGAGLKQLTILLEERRRLIEQNFWRHHLNLLCIHWSAKHGPGIRIPIHHLPLIPADVLKKHHVHEPSPARSRRAAYRKIGAMIDADRLATNCII